MLADVGFCSGDRPLKEALKLMNSEGVSSLAVVDNQFNVVGNISNADVKVSVPNCRWRGFHPISCPLAQGREFMLK